MPEACLVRPDREFIEEIIASGGGDLKKCMQCANCSVICELSGDLHPFPRKEMLWAQWGLKDRLVADPDVWLCHQCNDCSVHCPRGAHPGDVLAAVRQQAVRAYAFPHFLARWVNQVGMLPVTFLIPIVLITLALLARGPLEASLPFEPHRGFYAEFFPHWLLIGFYGFFTGLAFVAAVVGLARFWRAMEAADRNAGAYVVTAGIVASILAALRTIVLHDRFARCQAQASRRITHLAAFYGFLALFAVTIWATIDMYVMPPVFGIASRYPFDLLHPMKILANVGGVALVFGAWKAIADRRGGKPGTPVGSSFDSIFLWVLLGVGVTGFLVEIFRFSVGSEPGMWLRTTAYSIYFVHLVLVFQLLVFLPYSKFAHVLYRTAAIVYAEHTGRRPPARRLPARSADTLLAARSRGAIGAGRS